MRYGMIAAAIAVALGSGTVLAQGETSVTADLMDANKNPVGQATLQQMDQGVVVRLELKGLEPGWHAVHIHEKGVCEPPFKSAGSHLSSGDERHGLGPEGPHAGDLPNIHVAKDGTAKAEFFSPSVTFTAPAGDGVMSEAVGAVRRVAGMQPANLRDEDGSAIVVHAKPDDYRTDPAGASGDRIACGAIEPKARK